MKKNDKPQYETRDTEDHQIPGAIDDPAAAKYFHATIIFTTQGKTKTELKMPAKTKGNKNV